ncbi:MAG: hypothetical protein OEM82_04820 [Acidobacteriota bacterium]|nr:hypothetical protein [Acidobacteriota bacterium]MDH3530044.1 hypothetical protein [Acidobacteriota bacterium]
MEHIFKEDEEEAAAEPSTQEKIEEGSKKSDARKFSLIMWRDWLETDSAIQMVYLLFGFCAIVLLMVLLQFSTQAICCGDWDGYYHIRWSALIWENFKQFQWLPSFEWLPLTLLNPAEYADHHFFFHLLQIPFLWFFEPVMAAKIASVVYGSLAIFSVYWLLFKYKVDYLLLWLAALLTCANPFLYRMNMAKAPPLTIIYSIIGVYLLFERKYVWLLPLMFVFVWTYSLFPLLFIAACIWVAIIGFNERKFEWQPLAYTFGGMVLGNVINPYFPANIGLFINHFSMKIRTAYEVSVGGEWYPYDGWQLLTHLTIAMLAMLLGYVLFRPRNGVLPEKATFFLVFGTLLLIWMFKSKRLAEYFPPFAILFCAFSWKSFITPSVPFLPEDFRRDIEPLLDAEPVTESTGFIESAKSFAPWVIGILLCVLLVFNVSGTKLMLGAKHEDLLTSIRKNQKDDKYGEAMEWAGKNIPPGERIFNCNWDDFPKLFYFDTRHTYVYGLDPNYLYSKNPELYRTLKEITEGKVEDPGPVIKEDYGSNWVFTDAEECEDFVAKLLESGWAETVHEDGEAFILKIRDVKGEPPPERAPEPQTPEEIERLREAELNESNANSDNANLPEDEEELDDLPDEDLDDDDDLPPVEN